MLTKILLPRLGHMGAALGCSLLIGVIIGTISEKTSFSETIECSVMRQDGGHFYTSCEGPGAMIKASETTLLAFIDNKPLVCKKYSNGRIIC